MQAVVDALIAELGAALPQADKWGARIGADVQHARIVTGDKAAKAAAALDARAFTVGHRVFLGAGVTESTEGGKILAHELTHVAQQAGAREPSRDEYAHLPITPEHDGREHAAHHGDATQHLNTGISISKWGDGSSVTWHSYLSSLGLAGPLKSTWTTLRIFERGPFAKYIALLPGYRESFEEPLFEESLKSRLEQLVAPEPLGPLIDRARAMDYDQPDPDKEPVRTNKGSNSVEERPVVVEIANALARRYYESVTRMFPRVATFERIKPRPGGTPDPAKAAITEDSITVSHPMDLLVRKALLAGGSTMEQMAAYAIAAKEVKVDEVDAVTSNTPVHVTFAPEGKLWHWVDAKADDGKPPKKEQVAKALFGKPEDAHRLIELPTFWGFRARDVAEAFTKEMYEQLNRTVDAARNHPDPTRRPTPDIQDVADGDMFEPEIDPVVELVQAKGDHFGPDREKQNAAGKASGPQEKVDEANVVQLLKGMLKNLDDLALLLPLFRMGISPVKDARAFISRRNDEASKNCLTDPEAAYTFAKTQSGILTRIALGMANAAQRLAAVGGGAAPPVMREPLDELARAFTDALIALELPELANPRCAHAEQLAMNIDIALQEATLHERLGELEGEKQESFSKKDSNVDPGKQADQLAAMTMQLADARIGMRESPVAAQAKVQALKPQVDTLGFQIGLGEKLARLNMFWAALDNEEDLWESDIDRSMGAVIKAQNRKLYDRFKTEVFDPFNAADKANDDKGKLAAQKAYNAILTGPEMKEHGETVRKFLNQVAKHKKWSKFIVSLAITFVAFGLGQWEFGAVMAAEGSLFEAAIAGGLVTTTTSVVLNKVVFDQNPTAVGVLTSFAFNVGTFFVIGKLALAARAAAAEGALAEGTQQLKTAADVAASGSKVGNAAKAVGNYALNLGKEAVIAEAMGLGQAQVEKAISKRQLLTEAEVEDIFVQSLIGVVGMRVAHAVTPSDLFQYKPPEAKLGADIAWLKTEQKALSQRAQEVAAAAEAAPGGKPDKAAVMEVLQRWQTYLEREQKVREKLIEYAEKHPGKFKEADIAKLKAAGTDPRLLAQMKTAQAMIAVEPEGVNRFACAAGALDLVIEQHRAAGNEIVKIATDPETGQRTITVKPTDGSPSFEVTEKVPEKGKRTQARVAVGSARHFEHWLDAREQAHVPGQAELRDLYLRDPEAAINFAQQKYGYRPESVSTPELLVKPDAPGEAVKAPIEPMVAPGDEHLAVKLGHGVVAIGNGRFMAAPTELADMHATWAKQKAAHPGKIVYDPETNTSHFEMDVDGKRVRVEAQLAAKVQSFQGMAGVENRVMGGRISEALGTEILRSLVEGHHEMLAATGIGGTPVQPGASIEFGLGRLSDGSCVIVVGDSLQIDWATMPGIEPAGHTHPSTPSNDLPIRDGERRYVPLAEMLDPSAVHHLYRNVIFPSGTDFITMAENGIRGHKVYTPFVVEGGMVRKPTAGENLPRLEFTIGESHRVGRLSDGHVVYEATLEGKTGSDTPIANRKVWITVEADGNYVEMGEPPGLQREAQAAGTNTKGGKTKAGLSPEMEKLAKQPGASDAVHWALKTVSESDVAMLVAIHEPLRSKLMLIEASEAKALLAIAEPVNEFETPARISLVS